jgi:hypothetical protein
MSGVFHSFDPLPGLSLLVVRQSLGAPVTRPDRDNLMAIIANGSDGS